MFMEQQIWWAQMKELVSKYPGITSALWQLREEKVTQVHLLNSGYSQLFLHVIYTHEIHTGISPFYLDTCDTPWVMMSSFQEFVSLQVCNKDNAWSMFFLGRVIREGGGVEEISWNTENRGYGGMLPQENFEIHKLQCPHINFQEHTHVSLPQMCSRDHA